MTKEEFLKFWVKNPNELMPNPENRHKAVVIKDLFLKQLDEIISDAISNHEASQWKKYPENEPTIGHSYLIQTMNNDAIIISTYNDSWSRKVIAFHELPSSYKEGKNKSLCQCCGIVDISDEDDDVILCADCYMDATEPRKEEKP